MADPKEDVYNVRYYKCDTCHTLRQISMLFDKEPREGYLHCGIINCNGTHQEISFEEFESLKPQKPEDQLEAVREGGDPEEVAPELMKYLDQGGFSETAADDPFYGIGRMSDG